MNRQRTLCGVLALVPCVVALAVGVRGQDRTVSLTTVALRVHHADAMVAFYRDAFGARFRTVDARGIRSHFGEMGTLTVKLVPIRDSADFEGFAVHQLGFEVPDVTRVIDLAVRHGGRVHDPPAVVDGRLQAAIRDPDGNTVELYGPR